MTWEHRRPAGKILGALASRRYYSALNNKSSHNYFKRYLTAETAVLPGYFNEEKRYLTAGTAVLPDLLFDHFELRI